MSETKMDARVVNHKASSYDATDDPDTNMPSAKVPKFSLVPKKQRKNKFYYGVRIVTGSQKACSAKARDVFFTVAGTKSQSNRISLGFFQRLAEWDSFQEDTHDDMIIETDQHLGDAQVVGVGLEYDRIAEEMSSLLHCHWYVNYVSIIDFQNNESETQFPCYHWIGYTNAEVTAVSKVATLKEITNNPLLIQQRSRQTEWRKSQYLWKRYPDVGLPSSIDETIPDFSLPPDEEFHRTKEINFLINLFKGVVLNGIVAATTLAFIDGIIQRALGISTSTFTSANDLYIFEQLPQRLLIEDMESKDPESEITKGVELEICKASRWVTDEEFGRQILNGVNPVVIRRCSTLPDNFPVTHDMVKSSLVRNLSLQEEMKNGHVYICDLSDVMDGLPCKDDNYCPAPICLLYVNGANKLVPIAIQLKKKAGPDNPIFLPTDNWFDWVLAKIYYRSADAQFHQLSTHYTACHAAMEAYCVATMRNLPDAHPVYKLLQPHFRYTIGINSAARDTLINDGGFMDKLFSIGGEGKNELFRRASKIFNVQGANIKQNTKERGVDDPTLLPNYYYRDDGILIWNAIESYVTEIIGIFYKSDGDVKEDTELQHWANDVHFNAFPGHDGAPDGHGFPEKIESSEELISYCTLIIFNGSAQHAAVNFGQFDIYGFVPNAPFSLRRPAPTKKGVTTFTDILEFLPTIFTASLSIALVFSLAQFSPDEIYLGGYPNYWCQQEAEAATENFVNEMRKLDEQLTKRNETLDMPYPYLLPSMVPNSITI